MCAWLESIRSSRSPPERASMLPWPWKACTFLTSFPALPSGRRSRSVTDPTGARRMSHFYVKPGDSVSFAKTVGESDVYMFAGITGDFSVNHVNEQYMAG